MKLVSLKRPKEKAVADSKPVDASPEPYPWGTRITLEKEELDKLQITVDDFGIGNKVSIMADAEVVSLRESVDQQNKTKSVELQITAIGLDKPKTQKKSRFKEFQAIRDSQPNEVMKE